MSEVNQEKKQRRQPSGDVYTVEIDAPRNNDVLIQSLNGVMDNRLRGAISSSKPVIANAANRQDEEDMPIPKDQARHLGSMPRIPGMRLTVDVKKMTALVEDPLYGDDELCERIRRSLQTDGRPISRDTKIQGVKPRSGKMDQHRFKTLMREIRLMIDNNKAKEIGTRWPEIEDIDTLPGKYLLNPGSRVRNSQPQFEEEFEDWEANLNRVGG